MINSNYLPKPIELLLEFILWNPNQSLPPPYNLGQNRWPTILKIKITCNYIMNEEMQHAPQRLRIFSFLKRVGGIWVFNFNFGQGGLWVFFFFWVHWKNSKLSISFAMCEVWFLFSIKIVFYTNLHDEFLFCSQQAIWTISISGLLFWVKGFVSVFCLGHVVLFLNCLWLKI
jgi:hypothetical protein